MAHDLFISYSRKDVAEAEAICAVLEQRGCQCWIAPRDVPRGQPFEAAIVHAIQQSKLLLLLISEASVQSRHVQNEVHIALENQVAVIPVRLANVELSDALKYQIGRIQWHDAFPPPIENHLDALLSRLNGDPASETEPPPAIDPKVTPLPRRSAVAALLVGMVALVGTVWMLLTINWRGLRLSRTEPNVAPEEDTKLIEVLRRGVATAGVATPGPSPRLSLSVLKNDMKIGRLVELANGGTLRSGQDEYVIAARPGTAGYLYIFQIDSRGKVNWYFPKNPADPEISQGQNPVSAGEVVFVPPANSDAGLFLDEHIGEEFVCAVLAPVRWEGLEKGLAEARTRQTSAPGIVRIAQGMRKLSRDVADSSWNSLPVSMPDYEYQALGPFVFVTHQFRHAAP